MFLFCVQVVYILDQVRAMENEMLLRIKRQGLDITPQIIVVKCCYVPHIMFTLFHLLPTLCLMYSKLAVT